MKKGQYIRTEKHRERLRQIRGEKHPMFGKHHSEETKKRISMKLKGTRSKQDNPAWKGGMRAYCQIIAKKNIENSIGRKLKPEEIVHHLDFDTTNNNINNLHLFSSNSEHITYHQFLKRIVKEATS